MPMHKVFIWVLGGQVGATSNFEEVPAGADVYELLVPAFENLWDNQVYHFSKVEKEAPDGHR